jgi:hypothetical protein
LAFLLSESISHGFTVFLAIFGGFCLFSIALSLVISWDFTSTSGYTITPKCWHGVRPRFSFYFAQCALQLRDLYFFYDSSHNLYPDEHHISSYNKSGYSTHNIPYKM